MKEYFDCSQSPDGWNVTMTLELGDGGRFAYHEGWTDYTNASLYGRVEGLWRRDGGVVVFRAESAEGAMYFPWKVGGELKAVEQGNALAFEHGWTLRVRPEREVNIPVSNTGYKPLTVWVEPWGVSHVLEPGEAVR